MFLRPIVKTDVRVATWGQNFIKAYQPQSGVMLGLAIQLDHRFGSKWLLNKFHRLGYTQSYRGTNITSSMIRMELESLMILAFLTPLLKKLMSRSMMKNFCQLLHQPVKMKNRMMIRWYPWRLGIHSVC